MKRETIIILLFLLLTILASAISYNLAQNITCTRSGSVLLDSGKCLDIKRLPLCIENGNIKQDKYPEITRLLNNITK